MKPPLAQPALTEIEIEEALKTLVNAVLTSRRTVKDAAAELSRLEHTQQHFALRWVATIAQSNLEMAFQFTTHVPTAFQHLDETGVEAWIIEAMDEYDSKGLMAGIAVFERLVEFAEKYRKTITGLSLTTVSNVLELFICGLDGRKLKIRSGNLTYTDTENIYLPTVIHQFKTRENNFALYKTMAAHCWAQTWYGTWNIGIDALLSTVCEPQRVLAWFHALETARLNFKIGEEYPGLKRVIDQLSLSLDPPLPDDWESFSALLQTTESQAMDSWRLALTLSDRMPPPPRCYQGVLKPDAVAKTRALRIARDKHDLRTMLNEITPERIAKQRTSTDQPIHKNQTLNALDKLALNFPNDESDNIFTLEFGNQSVEPSEAMQVTMASIVQDLGEIPKDYLTVSDSGPYDANPMYSDEEAEEVDTKKALAQDVFIYNEWDYARQHYRKSWCVLHEQQASPRYDDFTAKTLNKYRAALRSLRIRFEALRAENKSLRKQPHGDDIDIDSVVEAFADRKMGREIPDNLFIRADPLERNIAVMLMVDMSGSTKGWINTAERESLVLLSEALETLGDRYAIYGFSGKTRKRCELYRIKKFTEQYDHEVQARISGITPKEYTRMGVAIRHLSTLLEQVEARHKLLITLSDGKPDDYVGYRGQYGIEDTRRALLEARQRGIHPFCITIDKTAEDYLPHMYGSTNYVVVDDVHKLPLKVSDIYRKLTR